MPALAGLNALLVQRADEAALVPRWHGLRVVAADGSVLKPALRHCHRTRHPAPAEQRLFGLYLPGAELMLHAEVYSASESERAMLVGALDKLSAGDVLVLDRGYPAAWLVALLQQRGIHFCMRCDGSGWSAVRKFTRSGAAEAWVTLSEPDADDARDWGCGRNAPHVRLVRQVTPGGAVRVLLTDLDDTIYPASSFADLYHRRWRIEEAFKRLKARLMLEAVSGLTQQALLIDVAAKVLADNLAALLCAAAGVTEERPRKCNRSYAIDFLRRALPRMLLRVGDLLATLRDTLSALAANTVRFVAGRSRPRPAGRLKPHPKAGYKG